jgi:hypothetical protein
MGLQPVSGEDLTYPTRRAPYKVKSMLGAGHTPASYRLSFAAPNRITNLSHHGILRDYLRHRCRGRIDRAVLLRYRLRRWIGVLFQHVAMDGDTGQRHRGPRGWPPIEIERPPTLGQRRPDDSGPARVWLRVILSGADYFTSRLELSR